MKDIEYYKQFEPLFEGGWYIREELGVVEDGRLFLIYRKHDGNEETGTLKVINVSEADYGISEEEKRNSLKSKLEDYVQVISSIMSLKDNKNIVGYEEYLTYEHKDDMGWDIFVRMERVAPFEDYTALKSMDEREVLKFGADICSALKACEENGIAHGDIKPKNIYVGEDGTYKLGNFERAEKLNKTIGRSTAAEVDNYAAPERKNSLYLKADIRSDIYSLGIMMYRSLNGDRNPFEPQKSEKPFVGYTEAAEARAKRYKGDKLLSPVNAGEYASKVILKACEFKSADRYTTAEEMLEDLQRIMNGEEPVKEQSSSSKHPKGNEGTGEEPVFPREIDDEEDSDIWNFGYDSSEQKGKKTHYEPLVSKQNPPRSKPILNLIIVILITAIIIVGAGIIYNLLKDKESEPSEEETSSSSEAYPVKKGNSGKTSGSGETASDENNKPEKTKGNGETEKTTPATVPADDAEEVSKEGETEAVAEANYEDDPYGAEQYYAKMVTNQDCNVRSSPEVNDEHNVLLKLKKGTEVAVIGVINKSSVWYKVSLPEGTEGYPDGCEGYISGKCLKETGDSEAGQDTGESVNGTGASNTEVQEVQNTKRTLGCDEIKEVVYLEINKYRQNNNCAPLSWDSKLINIAEKTFNLSDESDIEAVAVKLMEKGDFISYEKDYVPMEIDSNGQYDLPDWILYDVFTEEAKYTWIGICCDTNGLMEIVIGYKEY